MPLAISTDSIAPGDTAAHWRRCLSDAFAIDYELQARADAPFLARLANYRVGPLQLIEAAGLPFRMSRKGHGGSALLLLKLQLEGACTYRQGSVETRLDPGSFCLCPVRSAAEIEWHGLFRCVLVGIPESRLAESCPDWAQSAATRFPGIDGAAAMFVDVVKSLLRQPKALCGAAATGVGESLIGLLGAALSESARQGGSADSRLESYHKARIHKFIRAELSNPELDIPMIASSVGLSQRYIHRLFANEPLHLMQSVWSQRLEHCYRELTQENSARRPISDIAYSWGFNDPAHFSRVFRKRYGLTPRDLRHQARRPPASVPVSAMDTFDQAIFQS
jgi:AraC family transcriptional activator of tynA and feaB